MVLGTRNIVAIDRGARGDRLDSQQQVTRIEPFDQNFAGDPQKTASPRRISRLFVLLGQLIPAGIDALGLEGRRRARILVAGSIVLSAMSGLFLLDAFRTGDGQPVELLSLVGGVIGFASVPLVLRWTVNLRLTGGVAVGVAGFIFISNVLAIGPDSPALAWLATLPLLVTLFVGPWWGAMSVATTISVGLAVWAARAAGLYPVVAPMMGGADKLNLVNFVMLTSWLGALAWLYEAAKAHAIEMEELAMGNLRQSNRDLLRSRDQAQAASRAKSAFLATISHEMRTPLHGVIGMTSLLLAEPLTDRQRQHCNIANESARTLLRLIDDLLDLSKAEADQIGLVLETYDLHLLVAAAVQEHAEAASRKGLHLVTKIADDVPPQQHGDPVRVGQIVRNLVANAVKFTKIGSVAVDVTWNATDDKRGLLGFAVTDTGIGIPAEDHEHIFRPFSRVDASSTRRHAGTGLGLAICNRIVRAMGGSITLESSPGQGTRFFVEIPSDIAVAPHRKRSPARESGPVMLSGQDLKVLVVDDNQINTLVSRRLLEALGCVVDVANDGDEAVERALTERYDLILMDCDMPRMDGFEATRLIRSGAGENRRVPIVAMTAHAMLTAREQCLEAGMDEILPKPITLPQLRLALAKWRLPIPADAAEDANSSVPVDAFGNTPRPKSDDRLIESTNLEEMWSFAQDSTFAKRLLERFELSGGNDVKGIVDAAEQRDLEKLAFLTHRLKGSALNIGAIAVGEACGRGNTFAQDGDIDAAVAEVADLAPLLDQTMVALHRWHASALSRTPLPPDGSLTPTSPKTAGER